MQRSFPAVLFASLLLAPIAALSGGDDGPFHTYVNPASPGAPVTLPVDGVQNYGETIVDGLPLVDWDQLPVTPPDPVDCGLPSPIEQIFRPWLPDDHGMWLGSILVKDDGQGGIVENPFVLPDDFAAAMRTPWFVTSADGTQTYEYRSRAINLPSGVQALVFAPGTGPLEDFALSATSPCPGIDLDVLYWIPGTHGDPYLQNPLPWFEVDNVHTLPLLGGELGQAASWFRDGSIAMEAMRKGMMVVVPEWNVGKRPLLSTMAQLIELDRHLTSSEFQNSFTQLPNGSQLSLRNFITGGSYGGCVAVWAALYLDWMFQGAIARDCNPDLRQLYAFQEAYDFLRGQLVGNYLYDELTLTKDPYMNMLFNELEKGFGGPPGFGSGGVPADIAGMSLLSTDLATDGYFNLITQLQVPLILVTGDEDYGMYTFFERDLATENSLISEFKVPARGHPEVGLFEVWNQSAELLDQLMSKPEITSCAPPAPSSPAIEWSIQRPPSATYRSEQFHDEILKPDRSPEVNLGGNLSVNRVQSGQWSTLEVHEGLGVSGKIALVDVNSDGTPEIFAGTARGDLVGLTMVTGVGGQVVRMAELFRRPMSSYYGHAEVVAIPGTKKLLYLHPFGPLAEIELSGLGTIANVQPILTNGNLGRGLHSLARLEPGRWTFWNDEGELFEVTRGGSTWTLASRTYVEGGTTFVAPTSNSTAIYGSGHGFIKSYDYTQPGHPGSANGFSEPLRGFVTEFVPLPAPGPSGATWIGVVRSTTWRVSLFDDQLNEVQILNECIGSPPRHVRVISSTPARVDYVSTWDALPAEADIDYPGIVAALPITPPTIEPHATPVAQGPGGPQALSFKQRLRARLAYLRERLRSHEDLHHFRPSRKPSTQGLPSGTTTVPGFVGQQTESPGCNFNDLPTRFLAFGSPVSAIEPLTGGAPIAATNTAGSSFQAEWLVLLHSGQVVLVGDVTASPIPSQTFGEPFGSAFGLKSAGASNLVGVGPHGKAWAIEVTTGTVFQELANATGGSLDTPEWGDRAHMGADIVNGCVFGFYDGGDLLRNGLSSTQPLLAFAARERHDTDWHQDWGGVKVVQVDTQNCEWDYDDPAPVFRSDHLFATSGTASPGPSTGSELGNAVRWADLDGDNAVDLVAATHGGALHWFRNDQGPGSFGASPTPTSSTTDLGSRILALEIADLDGDSVPEVIIGTEVDNDALLPEVQLTLSGSIHVYHVVGGVLQPKPLGPVVPQLAGPFGIYGLRHLDDPIGDGADYLVAASASGRFRVYEIQPTPLALLPRYESTFTAPHLGAFNAIQAFDLPNDTTRLVFGSSGGLFAFDLKPAPQPIGATLSRTIDRSVQPKRRPAR